VGSVALLFTDIEGSTRLARALGREWPSVLEQHYDCLRAAILGCGGYVDHATGDGLLAVFEDPASAVQAAIAAQRALARHRWPLAAGELLVRMGLHRGVVEDGDHGYMGLDIHLAARVEAAAHGGQIVVTSAMHDAIGEDVPTEPLGEHTSRHRSGCFRLSWTGAAGRPSRHCERRPSARRTFRSSCARWWGASGRSSTSAPRCCGTTSGW
jgi:class 3 adenylate cyclase